MTQAFPFGQQLIKANRQRHHLRELLRGDGEHGVFALPPDSQLREELAVLPDDRDSEGRLVLPPKNQTARGSSEKSIRQLLGRSPDRADSLVLAVWGLRRPVYSDFVPGVLACSAGPEDDLPFTEAELQNCTPETRALLEYFEQRYGRTDDGQQPNWVQNAFPYDSQWD